MKNEIFDGLDHVSYMFLIDCYSIDINVLIKNCLINIINYSEAKLLISVDTCYISTCPNDKNDNYFLKYNSCKLNNKVC